MVFGITAVPMMVALGMAVDMGNASRTQQKLSGMVDAMALASAKQHWDAANRESVAQKFLDANLTDGYGPNLSITNVSVSFDDGARRVSVSVTADVPTLMMGIAGVDKITTGVESTVSYEVHASEPVSVGLVLDVSGSMRWNSKIGTLRLAATSLLDRLKLADPDDVYVRTGLVSYYSYIRHSVSMDWGIDHTRSVVQGLYASGGTASTAAVDRVGDWLADPVEQSEHESQSVHEGTEFELHKFMIFMTDGDNNYNADDDATEALCDTFKDEGIEIFSVAFNAPYGGRQLLEYCASSEEHYFDAQDSAEFLLAFELIGERIQQSLLRIVE
jgi:Flp pilus assembly protein TadG